jgi:hypothetical protein
MGLSKADSHDQGIRERGRTHIARLIAQMLEEVTSFRVPLAVRM